VEGLSKTTEDFCLIYDPGILLLQIPSRHNHSFLYKIVFLDVSHLINYRRTPVSAGNTFQHLPRLRETADNTERDIRVTYIR